MKIGNGDLILVCDGRTALAIENEGDEVLSKFKTREIYENEEESTRNLGTDKPGRVREMATVCIVRSSPPISTIGRKRPFLAAFRRGWTLW